VLRAAELDEHGMFDAVIAAAPNISAPASGRTLFDYSTEAALYAPCALPAINHAVAMMPPAARDAVAKLRCASMQQAGLLKSGDAAAQSQEALDHLLAQGWSPKAIALFEQGVAFELWRAVGATYAQAYARAGIDEPVCGYGFAMLGTDGSARASTAAERAVWWSDGSGIAPTVGIGIVDTLAGGTDPAFAGLMCLRKLWSGDDVLALKLRAGIAETRSTARPLSASVHVLHGVDDGLIPIDFSSRPYVQAVRDNGHSIQFTEVPDAQHFDAFVAFPTMSRYQPLLPHVYQALDAALAEALARH
jgi:hydroxybutyrate-dimer hydrolase